MGALHCNKKLDKLETARIKIRDLECITFKGWLKDFCLVNLRYIGIWEVRWEQSSRKTTVLCVQKGQDQNKSAYFDVKIKVRWDEKLSKWQKQAVTAREQAGRW